MGKSSGTFLQVSRATDRPGAVKKELKFPLEPDTYDALKRTHDAYVTHAIAAGISIPETEFVATKRPDGKLDVAMYQTDLSSCLFSDLLAGALPTREKLAAYRKVLEATLRLRIYSVVGSAPGIKLGMDSNPNNWAVPILGKPVFFDTMPPVISIDGIVEWGVLAPRENPTLVGRLTAALMHSKLLAPLGRRLAESYAFDWPTMIRTLLVKTIDHAPDLKDDLIKATREGVSTLGQPFADKLTDFSVKFELFMLKCYKAIDLIGKKKAEE